MGRGWWRHALQQRLATIAGLMLVLWTAATAVAASVATARIADAIVRERETRAAGISAALAATLQEELRHLDLVAAAAARHVGEDVLVRELQQLRLASFVIRIDRTGSVLWARSVPDGAVVPPILARVPDSMVGHWHLEGTNLVATRHGERTLVVLPARESDPLGGAVASVIDAAASPLRLQLAAYAREPYRVEIVDQQGREVAASRPRRADHEAADDDEDDLLVAAAAVDDGQWRVRLTQPRDEALGPVLTLRRILVGSSLVLLPFAVLIAAAAARSIRGPVLVMTAAAERLARGELAAPIPPAGEDEIGRLAHALEQLRRALESDERRALVLKHVFSAQEEERRRIARELHDQTTQQLTALAMHLDTARTLPPSDAAPALTRAHGIARAAIDDLHRVIYDLRPSMLDDLGLLPAIRSYAETHLAPRGIVVHCEYPDVPPELTPEAATALFRVAQEALTNVVRHARAEAVMIGVTVNPDRVVLEIEDDGSGFEPETMAHPRQTGEGLGLLGMRERLALFGGTIDIESEPGRGTRVVAVLPLGAHTTESRA